MGLLNYLFYLIDCHLNFHPHCINRAPPCSKGYSIPQNIIKSSSSTSSGESTKKKSSSRCTPLGPLNGFTNDIKKIYLPVIPQQQEQRYKSEGYSSHQKDSTRGRSIISSSIMT
jgi:hypothetical protein